MQIATETWRLITNYFVLAIKCDQYYDNNLENLAKQLFPLGISFEDLINSINLTGKIFIIILDQLDALSQTLSADRRWLNTYMQLINLLLETQNIRIIISTRSFDLEYDAHLIKFGDKSRVKHLEVGELSLKEVRSVLKHLKYNITSNKLLEVLKNPYNLELFSKIQNPEILIKHNPDINISRLHAELYGQLFRGNNLKISSCLNEIVKRMYSGLPNMIEIQSIANYRNEIDYLVSHGILFNYEGKLSFFHQSFYEYYLAQWFVNNNKDLITYIFDNNQNLYIRSLIKNVIDYLREYDHNEYILILKNVFDNKNLRYHIKHLLITGFGLVEAPTDLEKGFLYQNINSEIGNIFFEVFYSPGWIKFILEENLFPEKICKLYSILNRNINFYPKEILDYLEKAQIEETDKNNIILDLFYRIQQWSNELIQYFDRLYHYSEENEIWYFGILEKIALINFEYVKDKFGSILLKNSNNNERLKFDHRNSSILEQLIKINEKCSITLLLDIQLKLLQKTKTNYFKDNDGIISPLKSSTQYDEQIFESSSSDEKTIEYHLIKYYKKSPKEEVNTFFQSYHLTNFVPLLSLIMKILRDRAPEFVEETLLLLKQIENKNGFKGRDDFFSLQTRRLISVYISHFNTNQYSTIKNILFSITRPSELYAYKREDGSILNLSKFGLKKYLFLKSLPINIINKDKDLRMEYKELQRKFGEVDHTKPYDRGHLRWISPSSPLNNPNFEKFTHSDWLSSMKTINESFIHNDYMRGGILEHARAFEQAVEKRPNYFYGFIESLIDNKSVALMYITYGLSGLIASGDDYKTISRLIYKEMEVSLDRENALSCLWHSRFLIEQKKITNNAVDYWVSVAKWEPNDRECLNPGNELTDFINIPRGVAIHNLMRLTDYPQYSQIIFETLEYILRPGQIPDRTLSCGIIANLAHLNKLDIKRSFSIFKQLVNLNDINILKYSIDTAQYFNNAYHKEMEFYFHIILKYKELHKTSYVFVTSWVFDYINDYKLYDDFLKRGGDALRCAIKVAEKLLIEKDESINKKCIEILMRCLEEKTEDLSWELSGLVLRKFTVEHFLELFDFIATYIRTPHFVKDPRYLFKYLIECSSLYPRESLELLDKMQLSQYNSSIEIPQFDNEPLILVLAIYSKLRSASFKYKNEQNRALDQFDNLLTIPSIRGKAIEAIEKVLN